MILLCLSFIMCIGMCTGCTKEMKEKRKKQEVYKQAQEFVKERLKSPSTAQFPEYKEEYVEETSTNVFYVRSYYDAQNGYGAMVREKYECIMQYENGKYVDINVERIE